MVFTMQMTTEAVTQISLVLVPGSHLGNDLVSEVRFY